MRRWTAATWAGRGADGIGHRQINRTRITFEGLEPRMALAAGGAAGCGAGGAACPLAIDDRDVPQFVTPEDTPLVIDMTSGPNGPHGVGVLANDTVELPVLALAVTTPPASGGTVAFAGATGGFTYTPGPNFTGVDTFAYTLDVGAAASNAATVEIRVTAVDDRPTAVIDQYTVYADVAFRATLNTALVPLRSSWWYLDELTNGQAGAPLEDYPRDASSNAWNSPAFEVATSDPAIGNWKRGSGIFAQPLAAGAGLAKLDGTTRLQGAAATHTTDLFRRDFNLSAEQAGRIDALVANMVYDDGIVLYVNGVELFRDAMPAGAIAATTLAIANPSEEYRTRTLAVPDGLLRPGANTIAVELHQNSLASDDRGFDLGLFALPAGVDGWGLLENDFDVDGDALGNAQLVGGGPVHGTLLEFNADGTFVYEPTPGFTGWDSFQYRIKANGKYSAAAVVSITVVADDREPLAHDDAYRVSPQETLTTTAEQGVLANDVSPRGPASVFLADPVNGARITIPNVGTLTWRNVVDMGAYALSDGSFEFAPDATADGIAFIQPYIMADPNGDAAEATLVISIRSQPTGDLNRDGVVDRGDLAAALARFGTPSGAVGDDGDVNLDGRVDLRDLLLIRNQWGNPKPAPSAAAVVRHTKISAISPAFSGSSLVEAAVDRCLDCGAGLAASPRPRHAVPVIERWSQHERDAVQRPLDATDAVRSRAGANSAIRQHQIRRS